MVEHTSESTSFLLPGIGSSSFLVSDGNRLWVKKQIPVQRFVGQVSCYRERRGEGRFYGLMDHYHGTDRVLVTLGHQRSSHDLFSVRLGISLGLHLGLSFLFVCE